VKDHIEEDRREPGKEGVEHRGDPEDGLEV
jgi:hypothetical protein